MTTLAAFSPILSDGLYRLTAVVMLACRYDEDRKSPRSADRPKSGRPAADRAGRGDRPDRSLGRNQGPGGAAADAVPQRPGNRHHDDDRGLPGISGARLPAQSEHAEV